jgi:hypothetical protein
LTALSLGYFGWLLFLARGRESENPNDTKGDTRYPTSNPNNKAMFAQYKKEENAKYGPGNWAVFHLGKWRAQGMAAREAVITIETRKPEGRWQRRTELHQGLAPVMLSRGKYLHDVDTVMYRIA